LNASPHTTHHTSFLPPPGVLTVFVSYSSALFPIGPLRGRSEGAVLQPLRSGGSSGGGGGSSSSARGGAWGGRSGAGGGPGFAFIQSPGLATTAQEPALPRGAAGARGLAASHPVRQAVASPLASAHPTLHVPRLDSRFGASLSGRDGGLVGLQHHAAITPSAAGSWEGEEGGGGGGGWESKSRNVGWAEARKEIRRKEVFPSSRGEEGRQQGVGPSFSSSSGSGGLANGLGESTARGGTKRSADEYE